MIGPDWGRVSDSDNGYGRQIRQLKAELARHGGASGDPVRRARVDELQQEINARNARLDYTRRRRAEFARELAWAESEVNGFQKALVLAGELDPAHGAPAALGSAGRLQRRLESRTSRTHTFTAEITDLDRTIGQLEAELIGCHGELFEVLRVLVREDGNARREAQNRREARLAAIRAQRAAEMFGTRLDTMWSPTAVMGYRVWQLEGGDLFGARQQWIAPHLEATCAAEGHLPHTDGRCAEVAFGCGVYAAKSVATLVEEVGGARSGWFAVGLVGLEGKVVEHDRGYRAERATVLALVVVDRGSLRVVGDPKELETVFSERGALPRLGSSLPTAASGRELRAVVGEYLGQQARRHETWISANNSG